MSVYPKAVRTRPVEGYQPISSAKIKPLSKNHLKETFHRLRSTAGEAPGIDGITFESLTDFEWEHRINKLATAIRNQKYKVGPTRMGKIEKENGGFRDIHIYNLIDRVASKACSDVLSKVADKSFEQFSYGFRPGRGIQDVFKKLEECSKAGMKEVITFDVVAAFDNIPLRELCGLIEGLKAPDISKALANEVIRGTKDRNRLKGLPQGNALSGFLFNLYFDRYFDKEIKKHLTEASQIFRYVDDIVIIAASKEAAARLQDACYSLISKNGFKIAKNQTSNLETGFIEILGLTLCHDGDNITYRLTEISWSRLALKLEEAHLDPDPPTSITRTISGWREANKLVSWSVEYQKRLDDLLVRHGIRVKPVDIEN